MAKKICRTLVALLAFSTCLTLMSPPASAARWGHRYRGEAGSLRIKGNGGAEAFIPITKSGGAQCRSQGSIFEEDASPKSIEIFSSLIQNRFMYNGSPYVAMISAMATSPGAVPTSITTRHSTINATVDIQVDIYTPLIGNPSISCETNGVALCTWRAIHKIGLTWVGSTPLTADRELEVSNPNGATSMELPSAPCANNGFGAFAPPHGLQQFDDAKLKILSSALANLVKGNVTLTKTGMTAVVLDFNPLAAGSCSDSSLGLAITGTSIGSTSFMASTVRTFGTTGPYLAVFTRSTTGSSAGTLNTTVTPHTVTNMRVAVVMTVYNTTDCTPAGTPMCTLAMVLNLSGTLTGTTPGSELDVTGASVGSFVAFPTCSSGPSFLIGSSGTVTDSITADLV